MPNSGIPLIKNGMEMETLSNDQLLLVHVLLHQFYGNRKNKELTRRDIEYLHNDVSDLIHHVNYDKLDEQNERHRTSN